MRALLAVICLFVFLFVQETHGFTSRFCRIGTDARSSRARTSRSIRAGQLFALQDDVILSPVEILKTEEKRLLELVRKGVEGDSPNRKKGFVGFVKSIAGSTLGKELCRVLNPQDLLIAISIVLLYKPFLVNMFKVQKFLHRFGTTGKLLNLTESSALQYFDKDKSNAKLEKDIEDMDKAEFERSFLGHMEAPTKYLAYSIPILYFVDVCSVVIKVFGNHSGKKHNIPRLIYRILNVFVMGSFSTRFKDWILLHNRIIASNAYNANKGKSKNKGHVSIASKRDPIREATIDELTSIVIWVLIFFFTGEQIGKEFNLALGSLFAVGGIGSASFILALRSSFENVVGGLLLKIQDKFRVGEKITIPRFGAGASTGKASETGFAEEITLMSTNVRRMDNTLVAIPNHAFTQGEIINWSRTPYRIFAMDFTVEMEHADALLSIIACVKKRLSEIEGVASPYKRDVIVEANNIVSANNLAAKAIFVAVEVHFNPTNDVVAAVLKTKAIQAISKGINEGIQSYKESVSM